MYKATGDRFHTAMKNAIHRAQPVTITYVRADGKETVRTIEPYEIVETKAGNTIVKAMDRKTGECRSWRIDRVLFYTVHRTSFTVERTTAATVQTQAGPQPFTGQNFNDRAYMDDGSEIPAVNADEWASWMEMMFDPDTEKV